MGEHDVSGNSLEFTVKHFQRGAQGTRANCRHEDGRAPGSCFAARLVLLVAVHEGNDVDGDVISGAQSVVGYPPASILQHAPRPHDQVLSCHRVSDVMRGTISIARIQRD